jgi:hypothetical protein
MRNWNSTVEISLLDYVVPLNTWLPSPSMMVTVAPERWYDRDAFP